MRNLRFLWWAIWNRSSHQLLNYGYVSGRFRVRYDDGEVSMPMYYNTARDYAEIFGGTVILKEEG